MKALLLSVALIGLVGCRTDISSDYYRASSVGTVNRAVRGKIVSVRSVKVADESGVGAAAGGAIGAIGGGNLSGNSSGAAALAVAGAVAGGVIGHSVEKSATMQEGFEYVVETGNGALITLVQGGPTSFVVGEPVIVIYGNPARIIKADGAAATTAK